MDWAVPETLGAMVEPRVAMVGREEQEARVVVVVAGTVGAVEAVARTAGRAERVVLAAPPVDQTCSVMS